jgi:hypothetical protein
VAEEQINISFIISKGISGSANCCCPKFPFSFIHKKKMQLTASLSLNYLSLGFSLLQTFHPELNLPHMIFAHISKRFFGSPGNIQEVTD